MITAEEWVAYEMGADAVQGIRDECGDEGMATFAESSFDSGALRILHLRDPKLTMDTDFGWSNVLNWPEWGSETRH